MVKFTSLQAKYQNRIPRSTCFKVPSKLEAQQPPWKPPTPKYPAMCFSQKTRDENHQPREVARVLVEAACVLFSLKKIVVANCTLYHRNFPTSETFRKKTNRLNFPVTKKKTSKRPKITYPPGDFKALSPNNLIPCFGGLLRFSSPVPTSPLPKNEYEICKFQGFPGESAGIQPCNTLLCYLCWNENVKKCWKIA